MPSRQLVHSHRILVVNPVRSSSLNQLSQKFFELSASPGFEITCENLENCPESIESSYDEAIAAGQVAKRILGAASEGFSIAIINCFLDPGLRASREVSPVPVVGAGESAIRLALTMGGRFSIIDVGQKRYVSRSPTQQVRSMGVEARFASVRGIDIPVLQLNKQPSLTIRKLAREAELAVREDGAEVIVLGCTGLAELTERMKIDFPIVNPALAALRMAELVVSLGLIPKGLAP